MQSESLVDALVCLCAEVNFEMAEWRILPERMKMRQPYIVLLSRQALGILREAAAPPFAHAAF